LVDSTRILVVDDNAALAKAVQRYLTARGCEVRAATTLSDARRMLEEQAVDILFVDYSLPDGTGAELVRWGLNQQRLATAYCITGVAITPNVVEAMRAGCRDVLEKPFDLERLDPLIATASQPREEISVWRALHGPGILGEDAELVRVLCTARDVAESSSTVLITGESGTGKELMAQAIHRASGRRGPFIALNCAALPETLMEAELFGHTKGAFTGAVQARAGHIQAAEGGTLFLDEIGDMPLAAQARLLRVLQEKRVTPIGADKPVEVDVRVLAATHKNLEDMVDAATFREDLYFRLSVIPIHLPPLRNRGDDVIPLAQAMLAHHNRQSGKPAIALGTDAETALRAHSWPGNVRELAHTIERACLLAKNGRITAESLGGPMRRLGRSAPPPVRSAPTNGTAAGSTPVRNAEGDSLNLKAALDNIERDLIQRALERTSGNRTEAAALLGLNRTTLVEKLRKLE
jgi:two-component system, NtrC family, response regulator AtoC